MPTISVAVEPYDRHLPLVDRDWTATDGSTFDVQFVGQLADHGRGKSRHERMLQGLEFDVAELSLSSFLIQRQKRTDLVGLPIFPRRMFSFSNVWVSRRSSAGAWSDLRSGTIGVPVFQMSLAVVARDDMERVEDIPWTDFTWATAGDEPMPIAATAQRLTSVSLSEALENGEVDAIITPEIPQGEDFARKFRRLYGSRAQEIEFEQLRTRNYAPIVHILAARAEVVEQHPSLAVDVARMFADSYRIAMERYDDPAWAMQFWTRLEVERQRDAVVGDTWAHGLEPNRAALRDFCDAAAHQGLIAPVAEVDELFRR
ncbi:hypothetical protein [Rhodococcus sp. MEB064]|uniref:hypothetical protein n=1 Tax=Rhodococcus sp. MEB064 TaxID=1587522 RepID=UPI0005ACD86C|nr:hypothetical protein [Rhodococcus sp. MEB064]KIQ08027.1 hypothetical protein RU01_21765 [Rhodococcus sp. MEB064]